jgi:hypothetical protein
MAGKDAPTPGARIVELAFQLAGALVAATVSIGFVAFAGGVVLWSRFLAAELPADQAVAVQEEEDLVAVGAVALVLFILGGLLAVLLLRLLDAEGRPYLRTRRGLLVVAGLEILAGYLVEQWSGFEGAFLLAVALVGLLGLAVVLEQAARWTAQNPKHPFSCLAERMRQIFDGKVPGVSALRLWAGFDVLVIAVFVLALVEPWQERYLAGAILLVVGILTLAIGSDAGPERRWAAILSAVGLAAAATTVLLRESGWLATVAAIAIVLAGANLGVAHLTGDRFAWYGVTAFISVLLFGAAFNLLRALADPQAQGVALLRTNDAQPICGMFVAETDDRLYYGRVDLLGTSDVRQLRKESGRLLWVPRDRLVAAAIGPLEPLDRAQSTALDLRQEIALNSEPKEGATASGVAVPIRPPRSAQGADPCGPAAAQQLRPPSPDRLVAANFQPRLLLSREDDFWPVSVLTLFDLEFRGRVLCREPTCVPVRSQADLPFLGGENEWLEYPADDTDTGQQHDLTVRALGTEDPFRSARQYFLLTRNASGTTTIQYWYFYTFNYQPLGIGQAGYHEGDFEHVAVLLSREGRPRAVWMARHDDEGQLFLWDEPALQRRGSHVDIHVARGSHASYEACIEQQRRKAPFGFINDRPECAGTNQVALEPGATELLDLSRARWACWGGRFGHTRRGISQLEWELVEANGPRSPLWQQNYDGVRATPCEGLSVPENLVSEGEEPLPDETAQAIAGGAGRLDPMVDECSDWQRPQPQGAFVSACAPRPLRTWVRAGMPEDGAPGLQVLRPQEAPAAGGRPVAVRRAALAPTFQDWRVRAASSARVAVYAACYVDRTPLEATFGDVRLRPGAELRLDARSAGAWRLVDADGREVARATPRLPGEADGPNRPRRAPERTVCR